MEGSVEGSAWLKRLSAATSPKDGKPLTLPKP